MTAAPSLQIGLDALRANPLRTILSTLGVVMGVGSMVAVLAMGDGVETYGRLQVANTTDVQTVSLTPQTVQRLDGIFVERPDVVAFTPADLDSLTARTPEAASAVLTQVSGAVARLDGDSGAARGLLVAATSASVFQLKRMALGAGTGFTDADVTAQRAVAVLSASAADTLAAGSGTALVGRTIRLQDQPFTIIGVLQPRDGDRMQVIVPFGTTLGMRLRRGPPTATIALVARSVEAVDTVRRHVEDWLAGRYGKQWNERVAVATETARLEQITRAFRVFKLLMGSITGVSLLVGGIGIMNVLLASVTERTREIGIRKAAGARHHDILAQFLAESVTITGAGAALGTALGLAIAFLTAAIMRWRTSAPVHAAVTPGTIIFAAVAAIVVGLVFGLYPALRAARLSPIDAIRHE